MAPEEAMINVILWDSRTYRNAALIFRRFRGSSRSTRIQSTGSVPVPPPKHSISSQLMPAPCQMPP